MSGPERRWLVALAAIAVGCLVVAGCSPALTGSAAPAPQPGATKTSSIESSTTPTGGRPTSTTSNPAGTTPATTSSTSGSAPAAGTDGNIPLPDSARLAGLLSAAPARSIPWRDAWSANTTPTPAEFAKQAFRPGSYNDVVSTLQNAKVTGVAHRPWTAANATEADMILMEFASDRDADTARQSLATMMAQFFGERLITIPGIPARVHPRAVYRPDPTDGFIHTLVTAGVHRVVVLEVTYSPVNVDVRSTASWIARQLSALPGAGKITQTPAAAEPTASASRLPLPLSTKLQTHLVGAPPGSAAWQDAWGHDVTPTVADFVLALYPNTSGTTSQETALLIAQGISGIAHRTWKTAAGEAIDVRLLQFSSPGGAESRYRLALRALRADSTAVEFAVPSAYDVDGFIEQSSNRVGDHIAWVYGWKGSVEFEIEDDGANADQSSAKALVTAQTAKLPG